MGEPVPHISQTVAAYAQMVPSYHHHCMRMAFGCALPLGGAREAGEDALTGNADEFGRMKGEEESWGQ